MTKEITKAIILQEIQDKLGLREFEAGRFLFDETVIPVYNIEPHLQKWRSNVYTVSITSLSSFPIVTVPETERWKLRSYSVVFLSGAYTIAGLYLLRKLRAGATDFTYLDLTAAQTISYLIILPEAVVLEPGDNLRVNADGYTSTGSLRINIDYQVEEIR